MRKRKYTIYITYLTLICGFLLGIQEGKIALWRDGAADPVKIFPYEAASLPYADQQALEKGVYIEDESRLQELLEDYLS